MSFRHPVSSELVGLRLDAAVARLEPGLSRARARRLIDSGAIRVGARRVRASHRLREGERIEGAVPPPEPAGVEPEEIAIRVVYEDADLIVVDKPAGLVVHPAAGHRGGTLVNALLFHCGDLSGIGGVTRPGIVHRLDKGTSGLIVAAKGDAAHASLAGQFKRHSIEREYVALVRGSPGAGQGTVDAPIGRHPSDRKRFSTRSRSGRRAVSHWRVETRFREHTLLRVRLETGRTHQIRVHLASVGLPVAGDPVYGGGGRRALPGLNRPALHAAVLGFAHPRDGRGVRFEAPLAEDLERLLRELPG